ncbi:TetR/AcrR family transcriptional regulator C-terminal domain-containing protein [Paenibacillus filicis]|uniref:TetR/AcrR family transcriptional regulator C-terminal domain-containing protein n=1 Tax=Paenibacillus filicis TaxID=669464 RepID=A0ABU9DGI3_9BACL
MSDTTSPLDPRIKRTLHVIRDAFLALVDEKGFDQMTIRDITERAEINRATFYLHYRDKYDLQGRLVDSMLREFAAAFELPPAFGADDFIKDTDTPPASFIRQFEHIAAHAHFYKVMLGPRGVPGFSGRMERIIRDSLARRSRIAQPHEDQAVMPRELVVRYVTSAHLGVVTHWLEEDMPYTAVYMATQLIRLHALGATRILKGGT